MGCDLRVLYATSEWPSTDNPHHAPFIQQEVESLRQYGVDVDVYPFRGNKNPLQYLIHWIGLRRQFNFADYDLVHAHFGQSGLVVSPTPIPMVVTFHGSDLQGWIGKTGKYTTAGKVLQRVSRFVARRAQEIILVSSHLAEYLPEGLRFHIIPGGIDLELFKPQAKQTARHDLNLPSDKSLVLFPADPDNPIKRYKLSESACNRIKSELNLEIITLQGIPHQRVPLYMNACDVMLLTSKHEGSPTVVKEALACNLPVVSVDVGDVKSWIAGIDGCILCQDDQPETISMALREVLEQQKRINGRPAVDGIGLRKTAQKITQVYKAAVSG